MHQFIQADGIKMCCSSSTKLNVSPLEFATSDYLNQVKLQLSQGEVPKDCEGCYNKEQQGYTSTRTLALSDWGYSNDTVPNEIEYLDLRWSNLCNYSCRTCEPAFSSEIAREISNNPQLKLYYANNNSIHISNNNNIDDLLPKVKRINFTGGEPLLIKENIHVLEQLIAVGNTNCEIIITTNGSVMNPTILSLVKQFNSVHWTISIDAIGTQAEYIRSGTKWDQLCKNLHDILSLKHSVGINCVLSVYSVLGLSNLVNFFISLKHQYSDQPLELWFGLCEYPSFLNPLKLPSQLRDQAVNELSESIKLLQQVSSNPERSLTTLEVLHNSLKDAILTVNNRFRNYTNELDLIRNQNFNSTFKIGDE